MEQLSIDKSAPLTKRVIIGYFGIISFILVLSFLIVGLSSPTEFFGYFGVWITIFEIFIGLAAASQMSIFTSMSTIKARGEPVNEDTIMKQRLLDEELSFRKPWILIFIFNTILLLVISYSLI